MITPKKKTYIRFKLDKPKNSPEGSFTILFDRRYLPEYDKINLVTILALTEGASHWKKNYFSDYFILFIYFLV